MKHSTIIKKLSIFFLAVGVLSSCTKEELNPVLDVKLTMEQSNQFENIEVSFNQLFFYSTDGSKSNLQNMNSQVLTSFQLQQGGTQQLTSQSHFETQVEAIKMDANMYLHLTDGGAIQKVFQYVGDGIIRLESPVSLQSNSTYELNVIVNADDVLVIEDNEPKIDWSKAKVNLVKK